MVMALRDDLLNVANVEEFGREEFLQERWEYKRGEHVTFLAPTQTGKTTLKFALLGETLAKDLQAISLVMKPRDDVFDEWGKALKLERTEDWPPSRARKLLCDPNGWLIWPKTTFDPSVDDKTMRRVFRKAILWAYKHGDAILDIDEILGVADDLNLDDELKAVWSRGASMGCGLWGGSQRPSGIPLHAYSQAAHLFLGFTSDKRDRDRFREISGMGINADEIDDLVQDLGEHEWLYIRRRGGRMCRILSS